MDYFINKNGQLLCESTPLSTIAEVVGTPAYVYSSETLKRHCSVLVNAFKSYPTQICYAVKANSNLSLLRAIFESGCGADVVSVGEMERALKAGAPGKKIVFSGVGKTEDEINRALDVGILSFNVESMGELERLSRLASQKNVVAPFSFRINPNIDAKTNPYISTGLFSTKFGLTEGQVRELLPQLKKNKSVKMIGLSCHIGSQILELNPFREAAARLAGLAKEFKEMGFPLEHIDLGGGLGIRYKDENPPSVEDYAKTLIQEVSPTGLKLLVEPGRSLIGNVGVLLTRVIEVKRTEKKTFVIVDGAMNDLLRPSIYKAYHAIEAAQSAPGAPEIQCDIVGPVCETGDFLGLDRVLPEPREGDLLIVRGAGAYGSSMASNYNTRPRAPEVLVTGDRFDVIRPRETLSDLWRLELT